jgi:hypothetical protein
MEIDQENNSNSNINNSNNIYNSNLYLKENTQTNEKNLLSIHNKLIDIKRLQFNYIWTNKITQEDLSTPKIFDNQKDNLQISKNIFNSIVKFSDRTNEIFNKILNNNSNIDNKDDYLNLLYITSALIQKMKNFLIIKSKHFKLNKDMMKSLIEVKNNYQIFQNYFKQNELAKKLDEYYQYIKEFINMAITD